MTTQTYPVSPTLLTAIARAEASAQAAAAAADAVFKTAQLVTLDGVPAPAGTTVSFKDGAFIVDTPDAVMDDGASAPN